MPKSVHMEFMRAEEALLFAEMLVYKARGSVLQESVNFGAPMDRSGPLCTEIRSILSPGGQRIRYFAQIGRLWSLCGHRIRYCTIITD